MILDIIMFTLLCSASKESWYKVVYINYDTFVVDFQILKHFNAFSLLAWFFVRFHQTQQQWVANQRKMQLENNRKHVLRQQV